MRRVYFENWLLTKLGFRFIETEQGMRTYAKYDGEICGHKVDRMEVATSMHYIHISYKIGNKYWVFWKTTWAKGWLAKAEDVDSIFKKFFEENKKEINNYIKKSSL